MMCWGVIVMMEKSCDGVKSGIFYVKYIENVFLNLIFCR